MIHPCVRGARTEYCGSAASEWIFIIAWRSKVRDAIPNLHRIPCQYSKPYSVWAKLITPSSHGLVVPPYIPLKLNFKSFPPGVFAVEAEGR